MEGESGEREREREKECRERMEGESGEREWRERVEGGESGGKEESGGTE